MTSAGACDCIAMMFCQDGSSDVCRHQTGWLGLRNFALRSYRSLTSSSDAPAEDSLPLLGMCPGDAHLLWHIFQGCLSCMLCMCVALITHGFSLLR